MEKNIKESKQTKMMKEEEKREIVLSILKTKIDLDLAIKNYEFAEGEIIDYYLYQIKANKSKLDYLIKMAKEKRIIVDMIDKIKYDVS